MKKLMIVALALIASVVNATEVKVLETELPGVLTFNTTSFVKFQMDTTTKEGFANILVTDQVMMDDWGNTIPSHHGPWSPNRPTPHIMTVYKDMVKIDNLILVDDKVIYQGTEGEVECGKMGVSRVFKKPTLFLNGNCTLKGTISGRYNNILTVTLKTK